MSYVGMDSSLDEWSEILGSEAVVTNTDKINQAQSNCEGLNRQVKAILYPTNVEDIVNILRIASKYRFPLNVFSTGRNWGYGSSAPVGDGCVLLDMSKLDQILDFDKEAGLVTVEPGVTQRALSEFLRKNKYEFLVPVTGAGPDCSILGNALERGYGITPYADHFGAVMGLEAVLADGSVYRSMMSNLGGEDVDMAFKWGVGPYVDGLFTQGNVGIVTRMTIALAPLPECVETFFFSIADQKKLALAVKAIRRILCEMGGVTGSINLMNKHRMLSMAEPYPKAQIGSDGLIPKKVLQDMMKKHSLMEWTSVGGLYGNARVVKAAKKEIRKILTPVADRHVFLTPGKVDFLLKFTNILPFLRHSPMANALRTVEKSMSLFVGQPSEVALPLAYWRSGKKPADGESMNPARDGCGLIWYAPLIPMKPVLVDEFVEMVTSICEKHGMEPLITLTSQSHRCWDSTVPILFDKKEAREVEKAHACYEELLREGCARGFVPYRLGIQSMSFLNEQNAVPIMLKKIKQALDPGGIISPGRYGL